MDKVQALRGAEGRGEHALVASVRATDPDDSRVLVAGDMAGNAEKIAEVIGRDNAHVKALVRPVGIVHRWNPATTCSGSVPPR